MLVFAESSVGDPARSPDVGEKLIRLELDKFFAGGLGVQDGSLFLVGGDLTAASAEPEILRVEGSKIHNGLPFQDSSSSAASRAATN